MATRNFKPRANEEGKIGIVGRVWKEIHGRFIEATESVHAPKIEATESMQAPTVDIHNNSTHVATTAFVQNYEKGVEQRKQTGFVNKKTISALGYVTPHIGTVFAEIVGYTAEGYRRVKFTVQCACIEESTKTTEFKWLNFYNNSIGIATAYFDKYPVSKFIRHETLVNPMIYCNVISEEAKGYGAYVELSNDCVHLSRMYTIDGKIGMYPNSALKPGTCMFEFISDFTNE